VSERESERERERKEKMNGREVQRKREEDIIGR
jgi:hypothetical protein